MYSGLLVVAGLLNLAAASTTSYCCNALCKAGLSDRVVFPGVETYQSSVKNYFSQTAQLQPQCFFQPRDADEVSRGVIALVHANKTQPCQFAVRGGGHISWPGAAGIQQGVTFDLGKMRDITYHKKNSSVSIGAGAVWGDVYQALDKLDVMVTGGRSSSVGVGGLTLGGGNSFYAALRGWVCDNVLRHEIVLGNGSIVTASRNELPDLFQALKGGSINFGIVTRYDMSAFQGGKIFGGVKTYPASTPEQVEQMLQALVRFGNRIDEDPYASTVVISIFLSESRTPMFMNLVDYAKHTSQPDAPIFKEFFAIPNVLSDTTGLRNMTSLAHEFEVPKGDRVSFSTLTFKNDVRVLRKAQQAFNQVVARLNAEATGEWSIYTLYQPIPTVFAKHSEENGGNVLGLERFNENLILYEPYLKWHGAEQDHLFQSQARYLRKQISSYAKAIGAGNEYLYLNYADSDQNPLESYGSENVARIRAAAMKYDPEGVFQHMVPGGFKISGVSDNPKGKGSHETCWVKNAGSLFKQ